VAEATLAAHVVKADCPITIVAESPAVTVPAGSVIAFAYPTTLFALASATNKVLEI